MENQTKKSKKWIWLIVTIAIVGLLVAWCVINDVKIIGAKNPDKNLSQTDTFNFNSTFVL
jgi:hypothetical protein